MLETWCRDSAGQRSVELVGAMRDREPPETLYGMMSALLFRASVMGGDLREQMEYLGFPLPEGPYQVVLVAMDDPKVTALAGRLRHNCRVNLYGALREFMLDQIGDSAGGYLFLLMGYLLGILYPGEDGGLVERICRETADYAEKTMGVRIHVTVGTPERRVEDAERAFRMIQDTERSRTFYTDMLDQVAVLPENALRRIVDQEQRARFEQTFFQTSERVCGTIRAGEVETAAGYLREQLLKIAENCIGLPYPTSLNMTLNRFVSLLQYRLAEEDLADWRYLSARDFCRDLMSCATVEEFAQVGERMARELEQHARERAERRFDSQMRDIRRYVTENATDVNMGLTAVSREFKLKPREVAESFRAYYGESVNDVLHKARVQRAKELLLTTDEPVQAIAEAVGYCSLATMYRAFSNVEGVAPGKLRQTLGKHG